MGASNREILEYVEREGKETIRFHLKNMDELYQQSVLTLSYLVAAASACIAGGINILTNHDWPTIAWVLFLTGGYFFALAFVLEKKCLKPRPVESPANEPMKLLKSEKSNHEYTVDEIKRQELENLDKRIQANRTRNKETARQLNRVRLGVFLSPVAFLISWALVQVSVAWVLG